MNNITIDEGKLLTGQTAANFCTELTAKVATLSDSECGTPGTAYQVTTCSVSAAPTISSYITAKTTFVGQVDIPSDGGTLNIHVLFDTVLEWPYRLRLKRTPTPDYFEKPPGCTGNDYCFTYDGTDDIYKAENVWSDLSITGVWTSPVVGYGPYTQVLNAPVKVT